MGGQNLKLPKVFKSTRKNNIKIKKKQVLNNIDFGIWCNSKTNDRRYMKFSLNIYNSIFYI